MSLHVKRLTSIGAVFEGDNPEANILLWKRREVVKDAALGAKIRRAREAKGLSVDEVAAKLPIAGSTLSQIERGDIDDPPENVRAAIGSALGISVMKQRMVTETTATVKQWLHSITGTDSAPTKRTGMDLAKLGLTDEVRKEIEDAVAADKATIADRDAEIAKLSDKPVDVLKGISDEAKAEFEKQNAEIVKMQKAAETQTEALTKERDKRLLAEFTKTAEGYTSVLGKADEAGPMLKALASDEKAFEWLTKKLDAVGAIVKASDLFKELGVTDEGDPKAQIEALAKEKQKDNPKLSSAQAKVLVRKERPELKAAERETV